MRPVRRFTEQEDEYIRTHCDGFDCAAIARHLGRHPSSVVSRSITLGIRPPNRRIQRYTPEEDAFIREHAGKIPAAEIARLLGRAHPGTVLQRMDILGVRPKHRVAKGYTDSSGYRVEPIVNGDGKREWIRVHVAAAEESIGRSIRRGEIVHHIDLDKTNNSPDNLYVCRDDVEHAHFHRSIDRLVGVLMERRILAFDPDRGGYVLCETVS